ncbi:MAG: TlpA family protein disulfide reductase [Terriglobales bacterium]
MRIRLLLLLALAASFTACMRGSRPALIDGPAPDFTVQDTDRTVSLGGLRGKIVVLNFWATWCPPCVEEMPSLVSMQSRLRNQVTVLAVSVDVDREAYQRFLREHQIDLLTVRDPDRASSTLYGTILFPETYIIDSGGVLRRKFVGPVDWTSPEVLSYLQKLR